MGRPVLRRIHPLGFVRTLLEITEPHYQATGSLYGYWRREVRRDTNQPSELSMYEGRHPPQEIPVISRRFHLSLSSLELVKEGSRQWLYFEAPTDYSTKSKSLQLAAVNRELNVDRPSPPCGNHVMSHR